MTMQRRFDRRHVICCMPYTVACGLFIYLIFSQLYVWTARTRYKKVTPIKNMHYCGIYQAPGISFRASNNQPVFCDLCTVPAGVLLPIICVLLDERRATWTRSKPGLACRIILWSDPREARDEQQKGTSIKRRPGRRVMELLRGSYTLARFKPVLRYFKLACSTSALYIYTLYSTRALLYGRLKPYSLYKYTSSTFSWPRS